MATFAAFPVMALVQPVYHCGPKEGQGNFLAEVLARLFNWERVFATIA